MTSAPFNFYQQWYPLAPLVDLDHTRPTPVTLLGRRLVIWQSPATQEYCVFLDECPHRLAPLSEGRVDETGNLMCSYHGWQFDSQGHCNRVPQADQPQVSAKSQQRYCVVKFPSQQANGLLWVWADPDSAAIAASQPLPLSPYIDEGSGFVWHSIVRDLAYDWTTLVENVADPSHVPFAHHGVQGNRKYAQPIPIEIVESNPTQIVAQVDRHFPTRITFQPPCRLEYEIQFSAERQIGLVTYCVPVAPGKSRLVAQFPRNFAKTWHRLTPRWIDHVFVRNQVLDGDMVLLQYQERRLQERQRAESWKTAYTMPTAADRLVIEFRRWFDQYCNGQLPWSQDRQSAGEAMPLSREELLDRYHQHTQLCSSCCRMLKTIQRVEVGLLAYFAVTLAIVAVLPDALRLTWGLALMISALLGLGGFTWLKLWLEPKFYFVDYVHAEK